MDDLYKKIWELAKPYYEKGRPYDVPHIDWMMEQVERLSKIEEFNKALLMPICILHDVGYSTLDEKNPNIKDKNPKKAHMVEGAKISKEILEKVGYNKELTKKIVHYISVHDNWCLGDDTPYQECKEMAVFNDLDFLYATANKFVLEKQAEGMSKKVEEMISFWENDEKHLRRPFYYKETKKMFEQQIKEREQELKQ